MKRFCTIHQSPFSCTSYPRCSKKKTSFEIFLVHLRQSHSYYFLPNVILLWGNMVVVVCGVCVCVYESSREKIMTFLIIMNRHIQDQKYNKNIPHSKLMQFFYHKSWSIIAFFYSLETKMLDLNIHQKSFKQPE